MHRKFYSENLKGRYYLGHISDRRIILKWFLIKEDKRSRHFIGLGQGPIVGFCENVNKHKVCLKTSISLSDKELGTFKYKLCILHRIPLG
jgi:hypothetical protein